MSAARPSLSPVVPLAPAHALAGFRCGDDAIDGFIHDRARVEQALRLCQVYVTVDADDAVCGFFTLSPLTIRIEPELMRALGLPEVGYASLGGFLLGRLGVASAWQGRGIGEALVMRAAQRAKREAAHVGGAFLAVDPKDDRLAGWHARQGFTALGGRGRRMALALQSVP